MKKQLKRNDARSQLKKRRIDEKTKFMEVAVLVSNSVPSFFNRAGLK